MKNRKTLEGLFENLQLKVFKLAKLLLIPPFYLFCFLFAKRRKREAPKEIKKILIFRGDRIGDLALTFPVLRMLKETLPDARITLVVSPGQQELLEPGLVDEVIVFRFPWLFQHPPPNTREKITAFFRFLPLAIALRKRQYDLLIDFIGHPNIYSSFPVFLCGGRYRACFECNPLSLLFDYHVRRDGKYYRDLCIDLVAGAVPQIKKVNTGNIKSFAFSGKEMKSAQDFLHLGVEGKQQKIIAISPEASWKPRQWAEEKFLLLAKLLQEEFDALFILIGTPKSTGFLWQMQNVLSKKSLLAISLPIRELAAVISCCDLYVGNDTGTTHIATTLGIPTVILFGPGDHLMWGCPDNHVVVIRGNAPCSPCVQNMQRDESGCERGKPFCMDTIAVGDVFGAAEKLLARK